MDKIQVSHARCTPRLDTPDLSLVGYSYDPWQCPCIAVLQSQSHKMRSIQHQSESHIFRDAELDTRRLWRTQVRLQILGS